MKKVITIKKPTIIKVKVNQVTTLEVDLFSFFNLFTLYDFDKMPSEVQSVMDNMVNHVDLHSVEKTLKHDMMLLQNIRDAFGQNVKELPMV